MPPPVASSLERLPAPVAPPLAGLAGRSLDVLVALVLLAVAGPLLVAAVLLVWLVDGKPIFYRGPRLGRNGVPFTIYKLRTLKPEAEHQVRGALLGNRHELKTRTGNFLRETRLDELPQLFNVLRGDMALIGPRPERQAVYDAQCRAIPGYARRFAVRPGIFGYSQVFTPHSTPKRVRAWLDNRFVARGNAPHRMLGLLGLTGFALTAEVGRCAWHFVQGSLIGERLLGRGPERRRIKRLQTPRTFAHLGGTADGSPDIEVLDANEQAFRARGPRAAGLREGDRVTLRVSRPGEMSVRRARVVVRTSQLRGPEGAQESIVHFEPWSDNSSYVLEQYLLDRSIARLPRRQRRAPA